MSVKLIDNRVLRILAENMKPSGAHGSLHWRVDDALLVEPPTCE
jgi:hypothetical protein